MDCRLETKVGFDGSGRYRGDATVRMRGQGLSVLVVGRQGGERGWTQGLRVTVKRFWGFSDGWELGGMEILGSTVR